MASVAPAAPVVVPPPPAEMKFLCPACPNEQGATVIPIGVDDERVVCPKCSTQLVLQTRYVTASRPHSLDSARTRYELHTVEDETGRTRPRTFEAQPGLRLRGGTWVAFVRRGHRLVGVADQTQNMWNPLVELPPRVPALALATRILSGVCVLIAAAYLAVWVTRVGDFAASSPRAVLALVIVALVAAAPVILWTVRTGFGENVGQRRIVPKFRRDPELEP